MFLLPGDVSNEITASPMIVTGSHPDGAAAMNSIYVQDGAGRGAAGRPTPSRSLGGAEEQR